MQTTQQLEAYRALLWQQDSLDTKEYDRIGQQIADIENPARVQQRQQANVRAIRRELSENRKRFIGWRKVLRTNPDYARKHGADMRQRLLGYLKDRAALQAVLVQVQS